MRDDHYRLRDILEAIEKVDRYASRGRNVFIEQELIQTWIIHNIQIIGEAASNLSEDYCREHSEIPWAQIVAMRNILVHEYFGVDLDEIWRTVEQNLPVFKRQIQSLLDQPGNK